MKPDWKDAPEWAEWLCMDDGGEWYWFENKPVKGCGLWRVADDESKWRLAFSWEESLEPRPAAIGESCDKRY